MDYAKVIRELLGDARAAKAVEMGLTTPPTRSVATQQSLDELIQRLATDEPVVPASRFATSKGSQYVLLPNGMSIRHKTPHRFHDPNDVGWKKPSSRTVFLDDSQRRALAPVMATYPNGRVGLTSGPNWSRLGVAYTEGAEAGKPFRGTIVTPNSGPEVGLSPLEIFGNGVYHFGNNITEVQPEDDWLNWLNRARNNELPPSQGNY